MTTPANYFHSLRRQILLPFRKPMIVMSPKSLLRHPDAKSSFDEMAENTEFKRVLPDVGPAVENAEKVKKLLFCTGKVYYELAKERLQKERVDDVAITRVEQISPFPLDLVKAEMIKYPNAKIVWVQEEHKNMGAWTYVRPRFETALRKEGSGRTIRYVGRHVSASTATGNKYAHIMEHANMLKKAFE
jgi:2-oxoglutarate dehydrogenase E1 component